MKLFFGHFRTLFGQTDRQTDRQTDIVVNREVTLPKIGKRANSKIQINWDYILKTAFLAVVSAKKSLTEYGTGI